MMVYKFALTGAAGYIAPRHLKAIKDTNNELVAILDKSDSVGIVDNYFPESALFLESERFDRHLYRLSKKGNGEQVDYVSICSPNYLHDAHIRLALRNNAHAICEKPLVLNTWNIEGLEDIERDTGKKIFHILQLRLHPAVINLREQIRNAPSDKVYDIDLTYITGRGKWYYYSWKGNIEKSGGIITNIGAHFFDMLISIFGMPKESVVHYASPSTASGFLILEKARVSWFLSIDCEHLPLSIQEQGKRTYRSLTIDEKSFDFSEGFNDLHTLSYQKILDGEGFTLQEAYPYVSLCQQIRTAIPVGTTDDYHPFLQKMK